MDTLCTATASTAATETARWVALWLMLAGAFGSAVALVLLSRYLTSGARAVVLVFALGLGVSVQAVAVFAVRAATLPLAQAQEPRAPQLAPQTLPATSNSTADAPAAATPVANDKRAIAGEHAGTKTRAPRDSAGQPLDLPGVLRDEDLRTAPPIRL